MGDDNRGSKSSSSWWNDRRHLIVLAALGGTVAATVVVITISVVLRPAHVEFAVERATRDMAAVRGNNGGMYLNMTVNGRSTSRQGRAIVKYRRVFVDLVERSSKTMKVETYRAPIETALPGGYLEAGAGTPATSINASLLLVGKSLQNSILASQVNRTGDITVIVTAQVSFMIGVVSTGVYDVVVRCPRVVFHLINQTDATPVKCTG